MNDSIGGNVYVIEPSPNQWTRRKAYCRREGVWKSNNEGTTRQFKEDAVRLLNSSGKSGPDIEKELGIGQGQLYRWKRELGQESDGVKAFPGKGNPRDAEIARLKKELAIVTEEREILRKAVVIFSKPKNKSISS